MLTVEAQNILDKMQLTRDICAMGHKQREEAGINVRQPLQGITVKGILPLEDEYIELIKDELNVKSVWFA